MRTFLVAKEYQEREGKMGELKRGDRVVWCPKTKYWQKRSIRTGVGGIVVKCLEFKSYSRSMWPGGLVEVIWDNDEITPNFRGLFPVDFCIPKQDIGKFKRSENWNTEVTLKVGDRVVWNPITRFWQEMSIGPGSKGTVIDIGLESKPFHMEVKDIYGDQAWPGGIVKIEWDDKTVNIYPHDCCMLESDFEHGLKIFRNSRIVKEKSIIDMGSSDETKISMEKVRKEMEKEINESVGMKTMDFLTGMTKESIMKDNKRSSYNEIGRQLVTVKKMEKYNKRDCEVLKKMLEKNDKMMAIRVLKEPCCDMVKNKCSNSFIPRDRNNLMTRYPKRIKVYNDNDWDE